MNKDQGLLLAVAVIGGFIAYSFYNRNKKNESKSSFRGVTIGKIPWSVQPGDYCKRQDGSDGTWNGTECGTFKGIQ